MSFFIIISKFLMLILFSTKFNREKPKIIGSNREFLQNDARHKFFFNYCEMGMGIFCGPKKMARNEGKSTPGIRIRHRLSSKWTTKAAREQKRGPYAGS